ncbi:hypothetical protein M0802_013623 [Mischocyttarus mexicanus]|nr:hypothetical protein M0802_013623 [Mischocyttarus mexicanus]
MTHVNNEILKEEIQIAIKSAKDGKAPVPDDLPADVLKLIKEQHFDTITSLLSKIYESGIIPEEWSQSTFVITPKEQNAKICEDHRMISLISRTLKIFLKVIHRKIYIKQKKNIEDIHFGFTNEYGTREALFAHNDLMERYLDVNQKIHTCFIDYNKSFDKKITLMEYDISLNNLGYTDDTVLLAEEHARPSEHVEQCYHT